MPLLLLGSFDWPARALFASGPRPTGPECSQQRVADRPSAHIMVLSEVAKVETRTQLDLPHIWRLDHVAVVLRE